MRIVCSRGWGNCFLECGIINGTKEKQTTIGVVKGKMAKLDVNPFLTHWVITSLCGKTPDLESERDLRIRQVVNWSFNGQNRIGWNNLTQGRPSKIMEGIQEWWIQEGKKEGDQIQDSREVIRKMMVIVIIAWYQLWKQRSTRVIEIKGPEKIVKLMGEVEKTEKSANES